MCDLGEMFIEQQVTLQVCNYGFDYQSLLDVSQRPIGRLFDGRTIACNLKNRMECDI